MFDSSNGGELGRSRAVRHLNGDCLKFNAERSWFLKLAKVEGKVVRHLNDDT